MISEKELRFLIRENLRKNYLLKEEEGEEESEVSDDEAFGDEDTGDEGGGDIDAGDEADVEDTGLDDLGGDDLGGDDLGGGEEDSEANALAADLARANSSLKKIEDQINSLKSTIDDIQGSDLLGTIGLSFGPALSLENSFKKSNLYKDYKILKESFSKSNLSRNSLQRLLFEDNDQEEAEDIISMADEYQEFADQYSVSKVNVPKLVDICVNTVKHPEQIDIVSYVTKSAIEFMVQHSGFKLEKDYDEFTKLFGKRLAEETGKEIPSLYLKKKNIAPVAAGAVSQG